MALLRGRQPDADAVMAEVADRISELQNAWEDQRASRTRTRTIMNWGADGVRALIGSTNPDVTDYTPAPALMVSGLARLAQKIGREPTLKVPPVGNKDSTAAEEAAAKRYRIVHHLDRQSRINMQLPQVGRWLPGYGFAVWTLTERVDPYTGHPYVHQQLRDPFDCYPSSWGVDQMPEELAVVRRTTLGKIGSVYPQSKEALLGAHVRSLATAGSVRTYSTDASWDSHSGDTVLVVEYHNIDGTWLVCPELGVGLDYMANPIKSAPPFVVAKRFSFDRLLGQYEHMIGLAATMAKLNILTSMFIQDNVMSETNIIGEMLSVEYERGRDAVNVFAPGTRIEKPVNSTNYQVFQMIGTLERQLRIVAGYAPEDDGQTGVSWATGEGFRELRSGITGEVREYQRVIADALERLDCARLEWEEREYGDMRRPMHGYADGAPFSETYRASKDIAGNYRTRRFYGVMAGFDEPQKIVTGLQLLQGEIIDRETLQENLDGLDNLPVINERIRKEKAERVMFDRLLQMASTPGDPRQAQADMALVEIMDTGNMVVALRKFFTPQEPEMTPDEMALANQAMPGPGPATPDAVATVLSRLEMGGDAAGGIQTVGRL